MKKVLIFLTGIIVGISSAVFATYKINSSEVGFIPINESWKVDNVGSAINDLYTKQNETIVEYQNQVANYEKTISSQNTKISNYESTINQNKTTISNLNSQITELNNKLSTFTSSKCVSGTFVCTSCTTAAGQKIVDFEPSTFMFYMASSSTTHTVWYYDSRLNTNSWKVYAVTSSGASYKLSTTLSTVIKFDDNLVFYNAGSGNANKTFYYMACE